MSQQANLGTRTSVGVLLQENFAKGVVPWFGLMDPVAALFKRRANGDRYKVSGKKLVITVEANYAGGAMATGGQLPDHQEVAPITVETTPARRYVRSAIDNFMQALTEGPGAAENYLKRLTRQHLERFQVMERRHVHGSSTGTLCAVSSRTSATVVVAKNGYGYTGQPPLSYLEPGMLVASLDSSADFAVLAVAKIASINYSTNAITFATTIEGAGTIAADDLLVVASTADTAADHFVTERGKAPLGLLDIIDPKAANASHLGVTEASYQRWKPTRRAASSFGDMEFVAFTRELAAKSTSPVTPSSHTMTTQPGIVIALAEAMTSSSNAQFVFEKGKDLPGGYKTVRVAGHDFVESGDHIYDTIYALCMEDLHRCHLGPEFHDAAEDGSMYSRVADWDAKEWYGRDYMQQFADRRNRCGAYHTITNTNAARYTNTPA
jgi:hypothetical protein